MAQTQIQAIGELLTATHQVAPGAKSAVDDCLAGLPIRAEGVQRDVMVVHRCAATSTTWYQPADISCTVVWEAACRRLVRYTLLSMVCRTNSRASRRQVHFQSHPVALYSD